MKTWQQFAIGGGVLFVLYLVMKEDKKEGELYQKFDPKTQKWEKYEKKSRFGS
jgi:hypothetical protein